MIKTSIITLVSICMISTVAKASPVYNPMFKPEKDAWGFVADFKTEEGAVMMDLYYGIGNNGWVKFGYGFGQNHSFGAVLGVRNLDDKEIIGAEFLTIGLGYRAVDTNVFKFDLNIDGNIDVVKNEIEKFGLNPINGKKVASNATNVMLGAKVAYTPISSFALGLGIDYKLQFSSDQFGLTTYDDITMMGEGQKYLGLTADMMWKIGQIYAVGAKFTYNALAGSKEDRIQQASSVTTIYASYSTAGIDIMPYVEMLNHSVDVIGNATVGLKVGTAF